MNRSESLVSWRCVLANGVPCLHVTSKLAVSLKRMVRLCVRCLVAGIASNLQWLAYTHTTPSACEVVNAGVDPENPVALGCSNHIKTF